MTWWHFILVVLAICGVILNNHRRIECFYLWIITNLGWCIANFQHGVGAESVQNLIFLGLAFHGLWKWRKTSA